jgi:vitamin B12 transporter
MGGVINVITRKGEEGLTAKAEIGIGSFDAFKSQIGFSGRKEGFDYFASYARSNSNNYKDAKGREYKNTAVDKNDSLNLNIGYTFIGLHRIGVEFNYVNLKGVGSPNMITSQTLNDTMDKMNQSIRFGYAGETESGDWSWSLNYTYAEDDRKYYYPDGDGYSKFYPFTSNYGVKSDLIQAQVNYSHELFKLSAGWDYNGYKLDEYDDDDMVGRMKADYENSAFFVLGKLLLFDEKLIFSAGGRYDDYKIKIQGEENNSDENFSPSVGMAYLPYPWLKFRLHYAEGFRMPTTGDLLGFPSWGYYGNLNLKPETSKTWEFGFDIAGDYTELTFTYYQSKHKDFIVAAEIGPWTYEYQNWKNDIERNGIEIEASFDITGYLGQSFELRPYVNINLMTKYKDLATGLKIPYVPKMTAGYGIRFVHPGFNLSSQLNFHYFGPEYRDANETQRNSGYTVADLAIQKRILDFGEKGHLDIRGKIMNIFDKYYENVMNYPAPGRSFFVAVSYTY